MVRSVFGLLIKVSGGLFTYLVMRFSHLGHHCPSISLYLVCLLSATILVSFVFFLQSSRRLGTVVLDVCEFPTTHAIQNHYKEEFTVASVQLLPGRAVNVMLEDSTAKQSIESFDCVTIVSRLCHAPRMSSFSIILMKQIVTNYAVPWNFMVLLKV